MLGSMKLEEKGRFAPPPTLDKVAQRVSDAVAAWEGVHARTHWLLGNENEVDGADFYLGDEELGHIHLDSEAHVFGSGGPSNGAATWWSSPSIAQKTSSTRSGSSSSPTTAAAELPPTPSPPAWPPEPGNRSRSSTSRPKFMRGS